MGSWSNIDFLLFLESLNCSSSIAQMSSWHFCVFILTVFILTVYNLLWNTAEWDIAVFISFSSLDLEKESSWSTQLISAKWLGEEAETWHYQATPGRNWAHGKSSRRLTSHLISTKPWKHEFFTGYHLMLKGKPKQYQNDLLCSKFVAVWCCT